MVASPPTLLVAASTPWISTSTSTDGRAPKRPYMGSGRSGAVWTSPGPSLGIGITSPGSCSGEPSSDCRHGRPPVPLPGLFSAPQRARGRRSGRGRSTRYTCRWICAEGQLRPCHIDLAYPDGHKDRLPRAVIPDVPFRQCSAKPYSPEGLKRSGHGIGSSTAAVRSGMSKSSI